MEEHVSRLGRPRQRVVCDKSNERGKIGIDQ